MLEGENAGELISSLSEVERDLLYTLVNEVREEGTPGEIGELWRVDYVRPPPSMLEFIEDDYWMGRTLRPTEDNPGLFPTWKEILCRDFDLDSRVHNLVITGSLGIGKTYVMVVVFLYRLALASLLRNPQNFLGLSKGSKILYPILSITKSVVTETAFGDAMNFMANSPYFLEECRYNPELKYSDFRINLGRGVYLTAGSKSWHVIGRNTMGVCLDEGNWRLESNPDTKAYKLYDEVRTRISNRFQRVAGFLPAISILASSAKDESSFTEQVIHDIEKANDPQSQLVYRYAVYRIKRHSLKLKPNWFKVAHGVKNVDPVVLSGWYTEDGDQLPGQPHEPPPPGAKVELVPGDYHEAFLRNVKTNLQSLCGISTGGSHRLFSSMMDCHRCAELAQKDGLSSPLKTGVQMLPISQEDAIETWDYLNHPSFLTMRQSRVLPIRHPDALRFAHIDLATASMAGVAVCHLVGQQLVEGSVLDGQVFSEYRLVVEYDFILTIVAGQSKPISLEKIQKFFFWLRDVCHYRFGMVTADQYQSDMPLQMMETRGFTVGKLSVDRSKAPYYALRSGVEELRIRWHQQPQLFRELENLIDGTDKVDHPDNGSKDTSDAVAGAYFNAINSGAAPPSPGQSAPAIYTGSGEAIERERPPIEIVVQPNRRPVTVWKG